MHAEEASEIACARPRQIVPGTGRCSLDCEFIIKGGPMATALRLSSEERFQKWKDGIDRAGSDWSTYDGTIKLIVMDYNQHLAATPRFTGLDWRLIKAMLWTES